MKHVFNKKVFRFSHPANIPFNDEDSSCLYISMISELGCELKICPVPVKQIFENKKNEKAKKA